MAYSWGGFTAVQDAAYACEPRTLLAKCCLHRAPAALMMSVFRQPVFVGGRYLKLKRGVPQSPWFEDGDTKRVGESSVQVCSSMPHATTCYTSTCWQRQHRADFK